MNSALRSRCARTFAAGALSVALLSAGAAEALAADPGAKPSPTRTMTAKPSRTMSANPAAKPSITVRASKTSVMSGGAVTFTGRTTGMMIGSKVVLQQLNSGKWTTLKSSTMVKRGSSYALVAKLSTKGKQQLRVKGVGAVSPTVTVNVT